MLLDGVDASLSSAARAEWRQRVAWSYYIENQDAAALAMANTVRDGGSGAWVGEGDWAAGLAAWRLNDCTGAADAFGRATRSAQNLELTAAAYYWSSRALVRCRQPEKAAEQLRGAARLDETLYGMLAREQLGQDLPGGKRTADFDLTDWQRLRDEPNVRTAVALAEIGRDSLADEVLRLRISGLKAGTSTTLDLIDAQVNQAKAQTERAQAAHDYVKALADLLEACGLSEDFGKYMARADVVRVE